MHALRRRLRGCTWLALLAMVALALGPTISRLALPEEPSPRAALALGAPMDDAAMHHAAMDPAAMHAHHHHAASIDASNAPASPPTRPAHHHTLEHCALCAVAATAFAVAPAPPLVIAAASVPRNVAALPERGLKPGRTPRSPASSRGPPTLA